MLKPSVYGMSWCTSQFLRIPIRNLTGFKGFYFIKVRDGDCRLVWQINFSNVWSQREFLNDADDTKKLSFLLNKQAKGLHCTQGISFFLPPIHEEKWKGASCKLAQKFSSPLSLIMMNIYMRGKKLNSACHVVPVWLYRAAGCINQVHTILHEIILM